MANDEKRISLKVDMVAKTIELDAPAEDFDAAIERTKELANALNFGSEAHQSAPIQSAASSAAPAATPTSEKIVKPKTSARAGASSGRPGRIGSFEPVKFGFSEDQERQLSKFGIEKRPTTQAEQVAVAMYEGEKLLNRKVFNYNEIYTLMRAVGVKDLPKALDVLFLQMSENQWLTREEGGFALKFLAKDFVEQKLPKSDAD